MLYILMVWVINKNIWICNTNFVQILLLRGLSHVQPPMSVRHLKRGSLIFASVNFCKSLFWAFCRDSFSQISKFDFHSKSIFKSSKSWLIWFSQNIYLSRFCEHLLWQICANCWKQMIKKTNDHQNQFPKERP